jgi:hypothetical protein
MVAAGSDVRSILRLNGVTLGFAPPPPPHALRKPTRHENRINKTDDLVILPSIVFICLLSQVQCLLGFQVLDHPMLIYIDNIHHLICLREARLQLAIF